MTVVDCIGINANRGITSERKRGAAGVVSLGDYRALMKKESTTRLQSFSCFSPLLENAVFCTASRYDSGRRSLWSPLGFRWQGEKKKQRLRIQSKARKKCKASTASGHDFATLLTPSFLCDHNKRPRSGKIQSIHVIWHYCKVSDNTLPPKKLPEVVFLCSCILCNYSPLPFQFRFA